MPESCPANQPITFSAHPIIGEELSVSPPIAGGSGLLAMGRHEKRNFLRLKWENE